MNKFYRIITFILSLLVLFIMLFISYKLGKKGGIKKALYRITYISICVLIAFIVAPYLTEYILNFNLYPHGLAIHYHGLNFYRLIDFIEEVIVHSDVLNDIYYMIPNLKNLLMDFPQIIFIPITYLISFLLLMLFFLPIYLYLGYRRKRRALYNIDYKKSGKIWAGVLTMVQTIFLISITLTPINGLARIYADSKENVIADDTNICNQNDVLGKYSFACSIVETYNSTVFNKIGDNYVNRYVYDSLTKIHYNNTQTTLNEEILTIAQAGMVLSKTGLLDVVNMDFEEFKKTKDFSMINIKTLTPEEIDIIIKAFKNSLYTREVLDDIYEFSSKYLNYILLDAFQMDYKMNLTYDQLTEELRIVLNTINYILNNKPLLESIQKVYDDVDRYLKLPYDVRKDGDYIMRLMFKVAYDTDIDSVVDVYNQLKESRIYKTLIPQLIDNLLTEINVHVNINADPSELDGVILRIFQVAKSMSDKYINNVLWWLSAMNRDQLYDLADLLEYIANSHTMKNMLVELANFGINYAQLKLDIPTELLYHIKDWHRELELTQLVIQIVYDCLYFDNFDSSKVIYTINHYKDTVIFDYAWRFGISLLPEACKTLIAGKGLGYLVGEYV